MNKLIILLILVLIFYILYYLNINKYKSINKDLHDNPKHTLLNIFDNMSSNKKYKLDNVKTTNIYTEYTLPENKNIYLINNLNDIIINIKNLNPDYDFNINKIIQAYEQIDDNGNSRYVILAFMYDINNYYTIKIHCDFVKINNNIYVNSIGNDESSYYNIINRYDMIVHNSGFVTNRNIYKNDVFSLLDEKYIVNNNKKGIHETTLDFGSYISNSNSEKNINQLTDIYLPDNMPVKYMKHKYSYLNVVDTPFFGPGVITDRVDENEYSWLVDPAKGVNGYNTEIH